MNWEAWFTLAVVAATMAVLARDLLPPSGAFFAAMVAVLALGIITPDQAFSGFSNPAPITIAGLYVIAKGVERTGVISPLIAALLGDGGSKRKALGRLVAPTVALSAFLSNTPIVAMLTARVEEWAGKNRLSPSLFLMPLSFAAILGGLVTVIGTATHIVVSGLLVSAGHEPLGFFEITRVGLPIALGGAVLIVLLAPLVLPSRRSARSDLEERFHEFAVEMLVERDGPLAGRTVGEAGLRHLHGVFLVQIDRDDEVVAPVNPDTILHGGDGLRFVGKADDIVDLQSIRGLTSAEQHHFAESETDQLAYYEAVVGATSPLIGKTLRGTGFRGRYQGAVLAIRRAGQRIDAKLGSVRPRVGDTLLLLADPGFQDRWSGRPDFLLISRIGAAAPARRQRTGRMAVVGLGVLALVATGTLPLVSAILLGAVALVLLRVLSPGEARDAVDIDVVLMIASAFGLAHAMQESGLAEVAASGVLNLFGGLGSVGALLGVVVATVVLTELITNTAAALLIFPIAMSTATSLDLDPRGFAIALTLAASASFLTPIGYQTNIMVYGPGGYRFTDYLRLGLPITLFVIVMILCFVPVFWPL